MRQSVLLIDLEVAVCLCVVFVSCGRMVSDNMKALHLLLCVTGLLNESSNVPGMYDNKSYSTYRGKQRPALLYPASNATGAVSAWDASGDGATWLSDVIKTKLVPTVCVFGIIGGVTVRASDLRSSGRGFDSRPGRYQATYRSTQPSILPGFCKSSTGLVGWGYGACRQFACSGSSVIR